MRKKQKEEPLKYKCGHPSKIEIPLGKDSIRKILGSRCSDCSPDRLAKKRKTEGDSMAKSVDRLSHAANARVTQRMMLNFLELEANFEVLKMRYEQESDRLLHMVLNPTTTQEDGEFELVDLIRESTRPKWKEEFIAVAGKEMAEIVKNRTEPTISHKPVVQVKATIVLSPSGQPKGR